MKYLSFIILISLIASAASAQEPAVVVDLLGYRPGDSKQAILVNASAVSFEVRNVTTNAVALRGNISSVGLPDASTGDNTFQIDFSAVAQPGRYRIWIPEASLTSPEFRIDADAYGEALFFSLQSYYYQRCGTEVGNGSPWHHPLCHEDDAVFFDDQSNSKDMIGGWHDAGDYGKFVATGALSLGFMLSIYELQAEKFSDKQLAIPENANGVPDLLDEARWELAWLLKMQREDGGVHHKVTTKKWTGEYLPHRDPDTRYIFDVSSTATASFAAVTSLAARVFRDWDKPFARELLSASVRAWNFLEAHPEILPTGGFRNPGGVEGGEYGDRQDADERLWAAAELFRTTEDVKYHRYFLEHYQRLRGIHYPVSWQQVQNFAYYTYLKVPSSVINHEAKAFVIRTLTGYCDAVLVRIAANGYRYALRTDEYYWGSNSIALGYAFDLVQAYEATKSERYLEGALDQFHYTLGRNPYGQTLITGVGSKSVQRPYHQFSMMLDAGAPVPGLLVGGANSRSRLRGVIISEYPGRCYEDNEKNYYVNEVAINYTAPFVFLAGYFSDKQETKKQLGTAGVQQK